MVSCAAARRQHFIGQIALGPGVVNLAPLEYIPIPWRMLLSSFDMKMLGNFMTLCEYPVHWEPLETTTHYTQQRLLRLHCHCEHEDDLQGAAMHVIVVRILSLYLHGVSFNNLNPFYRYTVNYGGPTSDLYYHGSVFTRHGHFMYVQWFSAYQAQRVMMSRFSRGCELPFVLVTSKPYSKHHRPVMIFYCGECAPGGRGDTDRCARRLRRTLNTAWRWMSKVCNLCQHRRFPRNQRGGFVFRYTHESHETALLRFHESNVPIPLAYHQYPYVINNERVGV